mmetsp:Transcript_9382/g.13884  ORF Transcript_9382/g.13884 Transcript_9382/m.13884 type:complete len:195 (+) Transcript_9382:64-648(+)
MQDKNKNDRLLNAVAYGNMEAFDAIEKEGLINLSTYRFKWGRTPLHYAILNGQDAIVDRLLNLDISYEETDVSGYQPIHYAIIECHEDIVKKLIEKNVKLTQRTYDGFKPLELAVESANIPIISCLLAEPDITVNERNPSELTVLHIAIQTGFFHVVKILINHQTFHPWKHSLNNQSLLHQILLKKAWRYSKNG